MRRKWITLVLCVATVAMGLLWLKELSQRLARDRADRFAGPFLTVYSCTNMRLTPWFKDVNGRLHGPTWWALYDSDLFLVDFPPRIGVSVFGPVTVAYNLGTNDWLSLSEDDRHRQQWSVVSEFHKPRKEEKPNQEIHGTQ